MTSGEQIYREVARDFPGLTWRDVKKVVDVYLDATLELALEQKSVFTKFGESGYLLVEDKTLELYASALRQKFKDLSEEGKIASYVKLANIRRIFEMKLRMYEDYLSYKTGYYQHITDKIGRNIAFVTRRINRIKKFQDEHARYAT